MNSQMRHESVSTPYLLRLMAAVFLLIFTSTAHSTEALPSQTTSISSSVNVQEVSLIEQRFHYEMAKSALSDGKWQRFEKHYKQLGDYALKPYLDYSKLKYELNKLKIPEIEHYLTTHKGSFLETRLREQLLYTLAVKKRWQDYLSFYDSSLASKELQCYWLYARIYEHDTEAFAEVADIWQLGYSHPKACDRVFSRWQRSGGLTQDIAWTRFNNAMQAGNNGLARYVAGFLDEEHSPYAKLYQQVHSYPYTMRKQRKFTEQSLPMQQIIAHGIKRYARKNPKDALKLWEGYEAQQLFPIELSTTTKQAIATRLIRKGETGLAETMIANSRELQAQSVIESLIRQSLKTESWDKVLQWIALLDEDTQANDRWTYWRARALEQLNSEGGDTDNSTHMYLALSSKRSFYGFLSADKLGRPYALEHVPTEVSHTALHAVENLPSLRRARELWLKGDTAEAQAEWIFAIRNMESDDLVAAGELARRWGWYNKGIHAMITGNLWDHLNIRFPLAYEDEVNQVSSITKVTPDFIYAVARQESAFAEKARSSAGAMGLMQLMPATARSTARRNGIKHRKQDLFKAEHNIQLGGYYLNQLLTQYNGNRILAAAAYNAGPHRVDRWVSKNPQDVSYDIWIETIPFKETRGYVQNVLSFSVIYGYRLGQPRKFISDMEASHLL